MPAEALFSAGTLYAFLLVLARIAGCLVFVPLPGGKAAPEAVRAVFALAFALALVSRWPALDGSGMTPGKLVAAAAAEAALGAAMGVAVATAIEAFALAAQVLGLQAGYAYASTIDPNSEADSGIIVVLAQLMGGMLFFALGLDREILRLFALSLESVPAGTFSLGPPAALSIIHLGSILFSVGVRLAMPVVALLVMVDVALALVGRLNAQLQLLAVAFPAKMLTALAVLGWVLALAPRLMRESSGQAWAVMRRILGL